MESVSVLLIATRCWLQGDSWSAAYHYAKTIVYGFYRGGKR